MIVDRMTNTEFANLLSTGVTLVKFTKINGDERLMYATRSLELIQASIPDAVELEMPADDESSVIVFDMDNTAWRRIRPESIISIN